MTTTVVSLEWPNGGVTNQDIATGANIDGSKLITRRSHSEELFDESTTITALASKLMHIVRGSQGTLVGAEAIITTQATGADRTVTVDIERSTSGGAFSSILSTTIDITNSTVIRTPVLGVISGGTLADGDILRAVVTVAGSAGNQAQGLLLTLTFDEYPS